MEKLYMDAKEEIIRIQEENFGILNRYEGGATKDDFEKTQIELTKAKQAKVEIDKECEQCKQRQNSLIL